LVSSITRGCRVHFGAGFNKSKLSTEIDTRISSLKDGSWGLPQTLYVKGIISLCHSRESATFCPDTSCHRLIKKKTNGKSAEGRSEGVWRFGKRLNHEDLKTHPMNIISAQLCIILLRKQKRWVK
jgi:hypothetical protein